MYVSRASGKLIKALIENEWRNSNKVHFKITKEKLREQ